ncbi:MAG: dCTP deaminase [bacterium]|nr:dCTP deaminase [bacterium]
MGLKPDHWIRKMALEHGMIEPFVETQKRDGVISYGVSSYGYDMRVAEEFKVFTNVFSAIVDPKNFSPESFVDITSDVCIIPPNSFALARSVEYFRIPRSVLTICVGKSTYARCFSGDTKVALADGTSVSLEEMAKRSETGELFFGYSIGQFGRVMVTLLEAPRYIGRDALMEITLDNGAVIHATPDHEFITRDGRILKADELRNGESLMPLYRHLARGYEMVYQPANGHLYPTHRLADEWNLRHGIYGQQPSTIPAGLLKFEQSHSKTFSIPRIEPNSPNYRNHRVVSIRPLAGDHDVYCLSVPEAGNFALEAGIFVSNCGLIINVTPFEPEWEGHVTLEISNTTPLPAKVYANEGIAQVLFLEGDEVCEISYADKKGKYQSQTGVTLPKLG